MRRLQNIGPDIDASLKEIEYAFDTLKADGVGRLTSYGDIWQGDVRLQPVFDELNRRNAVVYTHPTDATCCHRLAGASPSVLEWFTDTSRTIMSLIQDPPGARGAGAGRAGGPAPVSAATRYTTSNSSGRTAAGRS